MEAWEVIRLALLENNNGSRVITTTRIFEVASSADDVYTMRPLSPENSKRLLCKRIFSGEDNSDGVELAEVRDKLLKKCDGLPLAVLTIAGALAGKTIEQWYMVYNSIAFGHVNGRVMDDMIRILSLSYYDLPPHLRTCLLYLSIFPEDYLIKKDFLIWRWIAEGFIEYDGGRSLFGVGESYFAELINRSMIQPVEVGDRDSVDGCRVHGAVLHLLRYLAREENFVTLLIDNMLSSGRGRPRRYLGLVGAPISELPDGIGELEFLQTLDLRETGIQELPRSICRLRKLMCLCVDSTARLPSGIGNLVALEDLRLYSVSTLHFVKDELGQLTKLRILEIRFEELDEQMEDAFLRSLSNLQNLQTLVVDNFGGSSNFDRMEKFFDPPRRLRRLTMTRTALPAEWIGSLSALYYLCIEAPELRLGDLKILGGLPSLRSLWISSRSNERPLVITAHFQRGAMPKVRRVEFSFSLRDFSSRADFGFGLENLLSLEHVTIRLHDKVHSVEAALRHLTKKHPRRPTITLIRDGEEPTDTAASNDTRTQEELAEMEAKQLEERRDKFIQELHEENLLLDDLQAQLMKISEHKR
uniref:Uncharacterized protein n=1 Tax=Oryza sativa subsp. japonica TaxID=39947 RepID=Q2QZF8_ORYSJ|nr:hypothetical protein LOC_Os11g46140 [Oryza sativa Japonica Group]